MSDTCKRCKHFCSAGSVGECRRHAPIVDSDGQTHWPMVGKDDWCGDWDISSAAQYEGAN